LTYLTEVDLANQKPPAFMTKENFGKNTLT